MQKRKPLVPKKDEWNRENYQGKTKEQVDDSNTFAAFAIICLLATLLVVAIHEVYIWLK
jgi:hypothetical protein